MWLTVSGGCGDSDDNHEGKIGEQVSMSDTSMNYSKLSKGDFLSMCGLIGCGSQERDLF